MDSTYHRDSIYVYMREYVHGDTVYLDRWRDRWRERVVMRTDTVYETRETVVQSPPERYVPSSVQVMAWIGGVALALLLVWLAWKVLKLVK